MHDKYLLSRFWRIASEDLPNHIEQNHRIQGLHPEFGDGQSIHQKLQDGLSCTETRLLPNRDLAITSTMQHAEPQVVLTLSLAGQSGFRNGHDADLVFKKNYVTLTAFNQSSGERRYQAGDEIHQLRFMISQSWLQQHYPESKVKRLFRRSDLSLLRFGQAHPQSLIFAQSAIQPFQDQSTQQIFRLGCALTIIASEFNGLFNEQKTPLSKISIQQKKMAYAARSILQHELKNPPSVHELALRVGTNEFMLKQLFHHCFQTTPYAMLLEFRMGYAYRLLESTHCSVSNAAAQVGYTHASNFTTAFTRFFGISPKQVSKK